MAGISDYRRQINFVLETRALGDSTAATAVLKGIWELTTTDPELGAEVAEKIIASLPNGALYKDPDAILYELVFRGWAMTPDKELEENLAKLFHSTKSGDIACGKITDCFAEMLKLQETRLRSRGTAWNTVSLQQHKDKLERFIVSAADTTTSGCVRVAAQAYLRLAHPSRIRALFVT